MLTDTAIKKAKPTDKPKKLSDSRGLFLLITTTGTKTWKMSYRYDGKQKTLSLGKYPDVSLLEARSKADEARAGLAKDIDPSATKKAVKETRKGELANSFEVIAPNTHD